MENINSQADNAVATMRALPWPATSTNPWPASIRTAARGLQTPTSACDRTMSMPGMGSYGVSVPAATTASVVRLCTKGADHKFSTRLGPPASPPV
jgi:hypothetical protein